MPQANKKKPFQVQAPFDDHRIGDLIDLEVDADGKPVSALAAARTRPYTGKIGTAVDGDDLIAAARKEADAIIKDAEAKAAAILDDAGNQAASIIAQAEQAKAKK